MMRRLAPSLFMTIAGTALLAAVVSAAPKLADGTPTPKTGVNAAARTQRSDADVPPGGTKPENSAAAAEPAKAAEEAAAAEQYHLEASSPAQCTRLQPVLAPPAGGSFDEHDPSCCLLDRVEAEAKVDAPWPPGLSVYVGVCVRLDTEMSTGSLVLGRTTRIAPLTKDLTEHSPIKLFTKLFMDAGGARIVNASATSRSAVRIGAQCSQAAIRPNEWFFGTVVSSLAAPTTDPCQIHSRVLADGHFTIVQVLGNNANCVSKFTPKNMLRQEGSFAFVNALPITIKTMRKTTDGRPFAFVTLGDELFSPDFLAASASSNWSAFGNSVNLDGMSDSATGTSASALLVVTSGGTDEHGNVKVYGHVHGNGLRLSR